MTNRKPKSTVPATTTAEPFVVIDYERGMLDCLQMLREEVSRLSDAQREAIRLLWNTAPEVQSLLNFASPATNIVGDVENRVVKRATNHLSARRLQKTE